MIYNIAERIRFLREKNGMTQSDLAKSLGISRSAVNSWEMSLSTPSVSNVVEMSILFGTTTDFVLSVSDKVLVDITDLTAEQQEVTIRMIHCLKKGK